MTQVNVHYFWMAGAVGLGPPPEPPAKLAAGYTAARAAIVSAAAAMRRTVCVFDICVTSFFARSR
jgi:hypothetical protein